MDINIPEVVTDLKAAVDRYEKAINDSDVAVLNELFWDSPLTVRYGVAEQLYGYGEIQNFRAARGSADIRRELDRIVITTCDNDFGTASCEYRRVESGRRGRQMQTWMRSADGWRVVAAHVSSI